MALVKRAWTRNEFGQEHLKTRVCKYWLKGQCNRNPCRFLHRDVNGVSSSMKLKQSSGPVHSLQSRNNTSSNPSCRRFVYRRSPDPEKVSAQKEHHPQKPSEPEKVIVEDTPMAVNKNCSEGLSDQKSSSCETIDAPEVKCLAQEAPPSEKVIVQEDHPKQCKNWVNDNCIHGEKCKDLHSWFYGTGFQMLAKLEGHSKAVTGIALPSGSDKLYSGSSENCIRVWDCNSGQCTASLNTNVEVRCFSTEGPWLFVGLPNGVRAWNSQTQVEFSLNSNASIICSMVDEDKLFAGTEDGSILVWKWNTEKIDPEPIAILKGHDGAICSLIVGGCCKLYSGSKDCTIKSWNRESLQCVQTLYGHTGEVTSVLCYDKFLLSASSDKKIMVWESRDCETIEAVHEEQVDEGVLALSGVIDSDSKPILLCSCSDSTVRLYDLPSFAERGRIFSKREVLTIQTDTDGKLFFTGDAIGNLTAWKVL